VEFVVEGKDVALKNAMTEQFELVEVLGKLVLYSSYRIDLQTIPDGYYAYDIRHVDDYPAYFGQLKRYVVVNYLGTIITNIEIILIEDDYLDLKNSDVFCTASGLITMDDYMQNHPADLI